MNKQYMAYDGDGTEVGYLTLAGARDQFAAAQIDEESGTITVAREGDDIIRHGSFGPIVWNTATGETRMATQDDLDNLVVGDDLTEDEEAEIEV